MHTQANSFRSLMGGLAVALVTLSGCADLDYAPPRINKAEMVGLWRAEEADGWLEVRSDYSATACVPTEYLHPGVVLSTAGEIARLEGDVNMLDAQTVSLELSEETNFRGDTANVVFQVWGTDESLQVLLFGQGNPDSSEQLVFDFAGPGEAQPGCDV